MRKMTKEEAREYAKETDAFVKQLAKKHGVTLAQLYKDKGKGYGDT
jgi:hypothetical protein